MLVYNAGLEVIKFGFNANSRSKRYGGYYKIMPGEQRDIPEDAIDHVNDPNCGPGRRGLVILPFGANLDEKKIEGLQKYIEFAQFSLQIEEARTVEMEQVGTKFSGDRREVKLFKGKVEKAEKAIETLKTQMDQKELALKDPKVKVKHLQDMIAKAQAELQKLLPEQSGVKPNDNSHSDNRLSGSESSQELRG